MAVLIVLCLSTMLIWQAQPWPLRLMQAGIGIAGTVELLRRNANPAREKIFRAQFLAALLCLTGASLIGLLQTSFTGTAVHSLTSETTLYWAALAAIFLSVGAAAQKSAHRDRLLDFAAWFGLILCALAMAQFYSSGGKLFWIWPSSEPRVAGPFLSRNNFASFAALLLPIALWKGLHTKRIDWCWVAAGAFLYACAVASGSRAGAVIATLEVPAFFLLSHRFLSSAAILRACGGFILAAIALVGAGGWELLANKVSDADPWKYRKEMAASAFDMAKQKPLTGWGLGVFPDVYPRFASFDSGHHVNHAHNDWLEWAAEGGIPLAALLAVFAIIVLRAAIRRPWALGVPAVFLHCFVDYPMQRLGLAGWVVAVAALAVVAGPLPNSRHHHRPHSSPQPEEA